MYLCIVNVKKSIIISAPSGAGKTTIVRHLLSVMPNTLAFSVSATTRKPRGTEQHGIDYFFLTEETFKLKIAEQAFVEYEEVYPSCFYGTLKTEVESVWASGRALVFDVDVKGAISLKSLFKTQALSVFIAPPNIEVLKQRLESRHTDTTQSIATRLLKAETEMQDAVKFDLQVINDDLQQTCKTVETWVSDFLKTY